MEKYDVLEETDLITFLSYKKKDVSKKKLKQLLINKMVSVNGKVVSIGSSLVKHGDKVVITYKKNTKGFIFDILYEDDDLIVIDKPCGLLSISNNKERTNTAYHMVSDYVKKSGKSNKIFVVHRLDEDTSGVLVFAKNIRIRDALQNNWNSLVLLREYLLVCEGKMSGSGAFKSYLKENHFLFVHSTNHEDEGKLAITKYNVIKSNGKYSLVKVNIETGRRNQIRVHFSENGHPIVGDFKYGSKNNPLKRMCLHASKLKLVDPRNKKIISFESDKCKEFFEIIN